MGFPVLHMRNSLRALLPTEILLDMHIVVLGTMNIHRLGSNGLSYPSMCKEGLKNKYLSMVIHRTLNFIVSMAIAKHLLNKIDAFVVSSLIHSY